MALRARAWLPPIVLALLAVSPQADGEQASPRSAQVALLRREAAEMHQKAVNARQEAYELGSAKESLRTHSRVSRLQRRAAEAHQKARTAQHFAQELGTTEQNPIAREASAATESNTHARRAAHTELGDASPNTSKIEAPLVRMHEAGRNLNKNVSTAPIAKQATMLAQPQAMKESELHQTISAILSQSRESAASKQPSNSPILASTRNKVQEILMAPGLFGQHKKREKHLRRSKLALQSAEETLRTRQQKLDTISLTAAQTQQKAKQAWKVVAERRQQVLKSHGHKRTAIDTEILKVKHKLSSLKHLLSGQLRKTKHIRKTVLMKEQEESEIEAEKRGASSRLSQAEITSNSTKNKVEQWIDVKTKLLQKQHRHLDAAKEKSSKLKQSIAIAKGLRGVAMREQGELKVASLQAEVSIKAVNRAQARLFRIKQPSRSRIKRH